MKIDSLPDPGDRYTLQEELGTGVCAKVSKLKCIYKFVLIINEEKTTELIGL